MEVLWKDFCIDGVSGATTTQTLIGFRATRGRITTLDHETFDHPVKQQAVVEMFFRQFDEVFFMFRCLIIQQRDHIAERSFDGDYVIFLFLCLAAHND